MNRVSVLMAVHNGERYVADAITSCLGADELVIVDDASTDRTPALIAEAVRRYGEFVRSLVCSVKVGLTVALKTGMLHCRSPYIARQDADDISTPGRFKAQADYLDEHPRCAVVGSRTRIFNEAGDIRRGSKARWLPTWQLNLGRNPIAHGSAMFRRDVYNEAGGYRETFTLSQDADLWLRMSRLGSIHILPDEWYCLREHPDRISEKSRPQQRAWAQAARWAAGRRDLK